MSLDKSGVKKIAHLARLAINESDITEYANNLTNILDLVAEMDNVDCSVLPMAHPMETSQRLREDKVTEVNQRDHFQQIAPEIEDDLYLVPKVIE